MGMDFDDFDYDYEYEKYQIDKNTRLSELGLWAQKDDSLIEISKMGDRHLYNTIKMLKHNKGEYNCEYVDIYLKKMNEELIKRNKEE